MNLNRLLLCRFDGFEKRWKTCHWLELFFFPSFLCSSFVHSSFLPMKSLSFFCSALILMISLVYLLTLTMRGGCFDQYIFVLCLKRWKSSRKHCLLSIVAEDLEFLLARNSFNEKWMGFISVTAIRIFRYSFENFKKFVSEMVNAEKLLCFFLFVYLRLALFILEWTGQVFRKVSTLWVWTSIFIRRVLLTNIFSLLLQFYRLNVLNYLKTHI